MSKTHDEIVKEVFDRDKALRRMALEFIVQNIPVHGNRTTLRALQLCFIAGYEAGHHEAWNEFRRGKLFENDEDAKAAYKEALEEK